MGASRFAPVPWLLLFLDQGSLLGSPGRSSQRFAGGRFGPFPSSSGMLLTGSVQGTNFMNLYLCLMMGITSGEWLRLKAAVPTSIPVPVRRREFAFADPQVAFQK